MRLAWAGLALLVAALVGCPAPCRDDASDPCAPRVCVSGVSVVRPAADGTVCGEGRCVAGACVIRCGDGHAQSTERCDDGNAASGDGCNATCAPEPGFRCEGEPSTCLTVCGDGVVAGGETCDDGATGAGDGCSERCTLEVGWACAGRPSVCVATCGDGLLVGAETCDDGAQLGGDGCSSSCTLETGWRCEGAPSVCQAICGDGRVVGSEACDDAPPAEAGDGCSESCRLETGFACSGAPSLCMTVCGDGVVAGAEVCDDGNQAGSDGCSASCAVENGWSCQGLPSTCATTCGDGVRVGAEQCDDMNTDALDGCGATCRVEVSELEPNDDGVPTSGAAGISGNDFDPGGVAVANATAQGVIDVALGSTLRIAAIGVVGDEDVFAVTNGGTTPRSVRLDVWSGTSGLGRACGSSVDLGLNVRAANGALLVSADDRSGAADRCPGLTLALLPNRTVYVHVVEQGDDAVVPRYGLELQVGAIVCGDGVLTPGAEECDDGNQVDGDVCSNACRVVAADEVEPNDTLATAQAVPATGGRVRAALGLVGDVDVYSFTLATPQVVRLETFLGSYGDCTATAMTLRLFDAAGTEALVESTSVGLGGCALLQLPLAAGLWRVQVEKTGNNAALERYFLELTVVPPVGSEVEAPNTSGANDTVATAEVLLQTARDVYVSGDHHLVTDDDLYVITIPAQTGLRAEIVEGDRATETCESNDLDSKLQLLDANGVLVAQDDDAGRGYCSRIDGLRGPSAPEVFSNARNNSATAKTYYLRVTRSSSGLTTPAQFVYRLIVTTR